MNFPGVLIIVYTVHNLPCNTATVSSSLVPIPEMIMPTPIPMGLTKQKVTRYEKKTSIVDPVWSSSKLTQKVITNL